MIIYPKLPSGHVVFCDDIRHEVSGKITFVGTYTNVMYINGSLPAVLPKLCMGIVYRQENDCTEDVTIKVFMPGQDDDAENVATFKLEAQPVLIPPPTDEFTFGEYRIFFEAPGTPILQEGRIRVRAYRGDDEIRLGTLTVALNPEANDEKASASEEGKSGEP